MIKFDFLTWLSVKRNWSLDTFGPGDRTKGVVAHIRKELKEIEESRSKDEILEEFTDVVLLALDAMWRLGFSDEEIVLSLTKKHLVNMRRKWPDWKIANFDEPLEHSR